MTYSFEWVIHSRWRGLSVLKTFPIYDTRQSSGPDWLTQLRLTGVEQLGTKEIPSADEDFWRYSPISSIDLDKYHRNWDSPIASENIISDLQKKYTFACICIVSVNGFCVDIRISTQAKEHGVIVHAPQMPLWENATSEFIETNIDPFFYVNQSLVGDPVTITIPQNCELETPIVFLDWIQGDNEIVSTGRTVKLEQFAKAQVIELQLGDSQATVFSHNRMDFIVEPGAQLRHMVLQDRPNETIQLTQQQALVQQDAFFASTHIGLGSSYARLTTDCKMIGRGSTGNLAAAYFGRENQTHDFRTFQDHIARDTTSSLLFKGVLADESHAIYTGTIHVRPDARGTNAFQTNKNIKLSEKAWVESIPNLQIDNNDVHCSHASTVSPIDEDQMFYLASRGVPEAIAQKLIIAGFFAEVYESLDDEIFADLVRQKIHIFLTDESDQSERIEG